MTMHKEKMKGQRHTASTKPERTETKCKMTFTVQGSREKLRDAVSISQGWGAR